MGCVYMNIYIENKCSRYVNIYPKSCHKINVCYMIIGNLGLRVFGIYN